MNTLRLLGLFAIIPTSLLLTVSFFVLFTIRKIEIQGLKVFGYVILAFLWIAAFLTLSAGVYTISTGRHPMRYMMQEMMRGKMPGMMHMQQMPPTHEEHKGESMMKY